MQRARVNPAVATRGSSRPRFDVDKAETLLEPSIKSASPPSGGLGLYPLFLSNGRSYENISLMQSSSASKRQRVADALPATAPAIGSPQWQGWDNDALWHSLFDPIPLPELAVDNRNPQDSSRKRR